MIRIVIFALCAMFAGSAAAHKPSDSYLGITVDGGVVQGQWDIALRDLDFAIGLDSSGDGGHIGGSAAAVEAMKFDAAFDASAWQRFRCVCAVCCVVVMVVCAACHVSDAWLCRCDPLAESIGALLAAGRVRAAIMVWRRHSAPALARPVVRQLHRLDVVVSTWRARAASRVVGNHCVRMR